MDNETQKIADIIAGLPPIVQEKVMNEEWKLKIADIIKTHNLRLDVAADLETEVFLIMIGLDDQTNLEKNLAAVQIPKEKIQAIIKDLDAKIFEPIKQALIEETLREKVPTESAPVLETRDDLLNQIENPIDTPEIKLTEKVKPAVTSAGDIIKTEIPVEIKPSAQPKKDPYREPIE